MKETISTVKNELSDLEIQTSRIHSLLTVALDLFDGFIFTKEQMDNANNLEATIYAAQNQTKSVLDTVIASWKKLCSLWQSMQQTTADGDRQ